MDFNLIQGLAFRNLSQRSIILGKNGCGKSYILKAAEQTLKADTANGCVRYISPERAGMLQYEPSIDNNIAQNAEWISDSRRRNQASNFKEQSAVLFRRLEMLFLRELQEDHTKSDYKPRHFNDVLAKINGLLDRVSVRAVRSGFEIYERDANTVAKPDAISSGESELISLAIEFLSFARECDASKKNFLLLDEPDVHLHPDLQERLAKFLAIELAAPHILTVVATHSTAFLSSLAQTAATSVAFMKRGDRVLVFKEVNDVVERILPVFGAHPLSNIFNEAPILLVEGEDDERIWQQAVRSSQGKLRLYPCVTDTVGRQNEFETEADAIIQAIYDDAKGFSLRDRDTGPEQIDDIGKVIRMRLSCRAAENLMLSDDVLALARTDWASLQEKIKNFVAESPNHPFHSQMKAFLEAGMNRKEANLKEIRNVLVGLMSNKPWEVLVGQTIAAVADGKGQSGTDSMASYLGPKTCLNVLRLEQDAA